MNALQSHQATQGEAPLSSESRTELLVQAVGGRNKKGRVYGINAIVGGPSYVSSSSGPSFGEASIF